MPQKKPKQAKGAPIKGAPKKAPRNTKVRSVDNPGSTSAFSM